MSPSGAYLLEAGLMLLTLALLLGAVVVASRRLGVGGAVGPLELVGRLPLEPRRAIYLVRVGTQVLVVGASEGGLVKLSELASTDLPDLGTSSSPYASLRSMLTGLGRRRATGGVDPRDEVGAKASRDPSQTVSRGVSQDANRGASEDAKGRRAQGDVSVSNVAPARGGAAVANGADHLGERGMS